MRLRNRTLVLFCAVLLGASAAATAFVLLDPPRRWFPDDLARNLAVDQNGLDSINDVDNGVSESADAVDEWNDGDSTHVAINIMSSTIESVSPVLGDGVSEMIFDDPFRVCTGFCIAATFTGFFDENQTATCDGLEVVRWTDSDIVWNTRHDFTSESETDGCSGEIFVEPVTTHEVGHLIGLGHSEVDAALMAPSISSCDNKLLHADDFDGRDALYDCDTFTEGGGGDDGGTCIELGESCSVDSDCCSGDCSNGRPSTRVCQ